MTYHPEVQNDFLMTVIGSPWGWLAIWLILINLVTFFVFGVDKLKAKRKVNHESIRRVPEKTLFLLAAIGGFYWQVLPGMIAIAVGIVSALVGIIIVASKPLNNNSLPLNSSRAKANAEVWFYEAEKCMRRSSGCI